MVQSKMASGIRSNRGNLGAVDGVVAWVRWSNAVYGYFGGGRTNTSTGAVDTTDKITFTTGATAASTASNLKSNKIAHTAVSDINTYGYFLGGWTVSAYTVTTDRIVFSTSVTASNTVSNISGPRGYTGGTSGTLKGYISGGQSGGTSYDVIDLITFSTGVTSSQTTSKVSDTRGAGQIGVSDKNIYGYISGGNPYAVTTDRISFSTDACAVNTVSNLTVGRVYACGISDNYSGGYWCGGLDSSAVSAVTHKIIFSTGVTSANTVSNLSQARQAGVSSSDGLTYGYMVGGNTGAVVNTADRIVFSTGVTSANTVSNITSNRYNLGGLSDGAV
jgi:hypothetical protein